MSESAHDSSQLDSLVSLFFVRPADLGEFERQTVDQCPAVYQSLLAHSAHMTVTVERHHGQQVGVQVLAEAEEDNFYQRKILLRRTSDDGVVQFGLVRLDLECLPPLVQSQVVSGRSPLGRVLIENGLLTEVQLCDLWKIRCGPELAQYFNMPAGSITYGRTARILVDGKCCIELLEIVAPELMRNNVP